MSLLFVVTACAGESAGTTSSEMVVPDGEVVVAHERELRGAWISTVWNGVWPSASGLPPAQAKQELVTILDALASARMNAVFFQVRSESDAVYASSLEPWSRFLTGTQGVDPGFDPLAFVVDEGHRRGIEVHAWLNPYRGLVSSQIEVAPTHVTKTLPSAARPWGKQVWMDPGVPEVRRHILDVIRDVVLRYDVDGIHFDDYFYPYPSDDLAFDDDATFTAHGGTLTKDDWRRSNVDQLVRETSELVTSTRADVRFGVSPFGIYRPHTPPGIVGLDAYGTLYCDPVRWMEQGWVDYLAPQLYWPTTQTKQAFGTLVTWWGSTATPGRSIFVGHSASKAYPLEEYDEQMRLAATTSGVRGSIFFSAKPLVTDDGGLRTSLATKHWTTPAATPPLANAAGTSLPAPELARTPSGVAVPTTAARAVAIYRDIDGTFTIDRLVPAASSSTEVALQPGRWALSVIDRRGVETRGQRIAIE